MKNIIDDVQEENQELSQEKQNDLFYTLLSGKTITEEIETSRGKFIVKFPKQKDLLVIDRKTASLRGEIPATSFSEKENFNLQKIAFLDTVVISGDTWFNNVRNKNKSFSWGDMPDANFVDEVFVKAWLFRNKVQEEFKSDEEKTDTGFSDRESVQTDVDNGLFSDVDNSH